MNIYWKEVFEQFNNHSALILGKVKVGHVMYNSFQSKTDNENIFIWSLDLPGKKRNGMSKTHEEAKVLAESALQDWLSVAGLK